MVRLLGVREILSWEVSAVRGAMRAYKHWRSIHDEVAWEACSIWQHQCMTNGEMVIVIETWVMMKMKMQGR